MTSGASVRIRCAWCHHVRVVVTHRSHRARPPAYCGDRCRHLGRSAARSHAHAVRRAEEERDLEPAVIEARYRAALVLVRRTLTLRPEEILAQRER